MYHSDNSIVLRIRLEGEASKLARVQSNQTPEKGDPEVPFSLIRNRFRVIKAAFRGCYRVFHPDMSISISAE
jgi:hypothetical protein